MVIQRADGKHRDTLRVGDRFAVETTHEHQLGFRGAVPRIRRSFAPDTMGANTIQVWNGSYTLLPDRIIYRLNQPKEWRVSADSAVRIRYRNGRPRESRRYAYAKARPSQLFADLHLELTGIRADSLQFRLNPRGARDTVRVVASIALAEIHRVALDRRMKAVRKPPKTPSWFWEPRTSMQKAVTLFPHLVVYTVGYSAFVASLPVLIPVQQYREPRRTKWYRIESVLPGG